MRKITEDAIRAFRNDQNFKRGNTEVRILDNSSQLLLHGNVIAEYSADGALWISSAGWETTTTKERLNGLPNVSIHQKDFQWFLNGVAWNGEFILVGSECVEPEVNDENENPRLANQNYGIGYQEAMSGIDPFEYADRFGY